MRWWDGATWTEHTWSQEAGQSTSPYVAPSPAPPFASAGAVQVAAEAAGEAGSERRNALGKPKVVPEDRIRDRPIYWENLMRIRFWQFTFFGSLILSILPSLLIPPAFVVLFPVLLLLLGWFWLRVQMSCHQCKRILAVTRLAGEMEVCSKCQYPTDKGLRMQVG